MPGARLFVPRAGSSAISIDAKSKTQAVVKFARQQTPCLVSPSSFMPLRFNFPLKRWTVWTWNSRRNLAEAAEFHTGSTWMKHSTQPRLKPSPCLPKLLCMSASLDWKPNPKTGDFWTLEALLYKDRSCQTRAFLISQTSTVISCVYTLLSIYPVIFWGQVEVPYGFL